MNSGPSCRRCCCCACRSCCICVVVEGSVDVSGARAVRLAMAAILIPGIYTLNPRVHSVQAVLLLLVMAIAASWVTKPLG